MEQVTSPGHRVNINISAKTSKIEERSPYRKLKGDKVVEYSFPRFLTTGINPIQVAKILQLKKEPYTEKL